MWISIKDCGKQLTVHSKIREVNGNQIKIYDVVEVENDQYKLELITRNDLLITDKLQQTLSCQQLVTFNFEVEQGGTQ